MVDFEWPPSPTVDDELVGPDGQSYRWDGEKWVAIRYVLGEIDAGDY